MWLTVGIVSSLIFIMAVFKTVVLTKKGNPVARKWRLLAIIALMWIIVGFSNASGQ